MIHSGSDSLLIAVTPTAEGALSFSIATSNGELTDTTSCTFSFVDRNNAVWSTTSASQSLTEGVASTVDLTQYFFESVTPADVTLSSDIGTIEENGTWHYTPPWGSQAALSATVSGKRGESTQYLTLSLTIAAGDESDPVITFADPSTDTRTVSSSQTTVSVTVSDEGAGVAVVSFAYGDTTVTGTNESNDIWSAVISGLTEGVATAVEITATDASMNRNSSKKTVTLTYDATMEDVDAPVFTHVSGPQSSDRVTAATGTLSYTITDGSGVDSVWWTLNDVFVAAVPASDNTYTISYTFTSFGENVIRLYAKDGSGSGNEGSRTVTLNYNTEVTEVTPSGPQDAATDVSLTPSFTWTGGTDADGDSVFYRVLYGTSSTELSQMTSILTSNIVTLTSAGQLSPTTDYYWQVVAWSKTFPDTTKSDIISFTTLDPSAEDLTGPQISQTTGPEDGDRVTSETGTITVSVSDPNGIASVTAMLNTGAAQTLTAGANNTCAYNYTLSSYGVNTIIITATDGSANSNTSSETITLNYNTELTAITLTTPMANANGVSTTPTFEWSGGDDADGDGVNYTVNYGISQTSLGGTASVNAKTATVSSALEYNTTYYWQVTATSASTAYPDEVQSSVGTFTTEGSPPTISAHPQSQEVEEGESVTFSVTATQTGSGHFRISGGRMVCQLVPTVVRILFQR